MGFYHDTVTKADIKAQERRCQFYRNRIAEIEENLLEVEGDEPLDSDIQYDSTLGNPVELSDSSLEITSSADDINHEYKNTNVAVIAARLQKLIKKRKYLSARLRAKKGLASSSTPSKDNTPAGKARAFAIATERERQRRDRRALIQARRLRMLAQHGAELDVPFEQPKPPEKKDDDDDEPDDDDDDEEGKSKPDPNSIEMVRELLSGPTGQFVKLNYVQRWKLKINGWKEWKNAFEARIALNENRKAKVEAVVKAMDDALLAGDEKLAESLGNEQRNARKIEVLNARIARLRAKNDAITKKIDARLAKLEARCLLVPGKTRLSKKLALSEALKLDLLTEFYPERLPPPPAPKEEDDEDD